VNKEEMATPRKLSDQIGDLPRRAIALTFGKKLKSMTIIKRIGYSHAAITVAWFSSSAIDSNQIINSILGDSGCAAISLFLALPLTWLVGLIVGFPLFPSWPEHIARMTLMGAVVIANGLLIGFCINWVITRSGSHNRSKTNKNLKKSEQATPRKPSD